MDEWGKFNEIKLPEKEEFYSNLNMEDITDADTDTYTDADTYADTCMQKEFVKTLK